MEKYIKGEVLNKVMNRRKFIEQIGRALTLGQLTNLLSKQGKTQNTSLAQPDTVDIILNIDQKVIGTYEAIVKLKTLQELDGFQLVTMGDSAKVREIGISKKNELEPLDVQLNQWDAGAAMGAFAFDTLGNYIGSLPAGDYEIAKLKIDSDGVLTPDDFTFGIVLSDINAQSIPYRISVENFTPIQNQDPFTGIPKEYKLFQNYPNPFNSSTKIGYNVPKRSKVKIDVYDILGKKVDSITDKVHTPGHYLTKWNAGNFPSGVYLLKMTADGYQTTHQITLTK